MKFSAKVLVASVALAVGGAAQAAIESDDAMNPGNGDGGGQLFLSVVDRGATSPMSYVLNLGVTAAEFIANDSSSYELSFAADSNLQTLLANPGGTVAWNIAAAHSMYGPNLDDLGYLSTAPMPPNPSSDTVLGIPGISGALTKIGTYLLPVNTLMGANNSVLVTSSSSMAYHDFEGAWGDTWHTSLHSTEAGLDESLGFYFVATNVSVDGDGSSSRVVPFLGTWTLAANGELTYSAVPVPAAVWLLGSALIGMAGVARRKNNLQALQA